jgi:hypothetical protein
MSYEGFKQSLGENETFETDFIGASEEACQQLVRENRRGLIAYEQLAIADARTAKDGTILIQVYQEGDPSFDEEQVAPFPPFGILPPRDRDNTWWSYRVDFKDAPRALIDLGEFGIIENALPYYGYKDKLTDERGVFNVVKASRIALGEEDPEAILSEDSRNPQA